MNCIGKCARNDIEEGHDERSHLSAISFPSLNFIYSKEEEDGADDLPPDATPTFSYDAEGTDGAGILDIAFYESDDDDDGYPTDEHSLTSPEEKRRRRLHILQLARNRLAWKATDDAPEGPDDGDDSGDDSTFLGNVDVADVECAAPDDSTFLAEAAVEDVAVEGTTSFDEHIGDVDTLASTYDVHASNLSRASTKASTIGDQILKESAKAARMAKSEDVGNGPDNQSTSTYSYRKAFTDNITLGSTRASACSALTDDYCYDARKTGMSDALMQRKVPEEEPCDGGKLQRVNSRPADVDTGKEMLSSGISREESLARPPPHCLPYHSSNAMMYENEGLEHLARVVSFADGEGYVDEEAAHKDGGAGCCGWFASSPRAVKLIVLFSTLLMLVSVASLSIALLMPEGSIFGSRSSATSSDISALDANGSGPDGNDSVESTDWLNYPPALKNETKAPAAPSSQDVASGAPTISPSGSPEEDFIFSASSTTKSPSRAPSKRPTLDPTAEPTPYPTTRKPTNVPTPLPSKEPTRQPTATQILTMRATRDTYVSQSSPDENYGTSSRFKIDGAPSKWAFIAFDTAFSTENSVEIERQSWPTEKDEPRALETIRVVEAKLRLYTLGDEGGGCLVYALPNANWWPETDVTWDNQYEVVDRGGTSFAGSSGWMDAYSWYEIDVTAALQSRMVRSFLIKSSSSDGVSFASRERGDGAYAPELVLKFQLGSD